MDAEGGLVRFPRAAVDLFYIHAIDIDSYGLLDEIDTNDQTVLLLPRDQDAFSANEDATLDPYSHAFDEIGMGIIGQALLHHRPYRGDLLLGHRDGPAADTHNACDTDRFQHGDSVWQSKVAKEVPPEQWNLDNLYTVLPDATLAPQRQQVYDALGGELVVDHLFVP